MDILLKIFTTLGLVLLNAGFVAVEFAAVSARAGRLKPMARTSFLARAALQVKNHLGLYLSSCQLGNTLAALALGAVTEPAVASLVEPVTALFGMSYAAKRVLAFLLSFAIAVTLHIVIGEQAPKTLSIRYADRILMQLAPPLIAFTYLFYPAIWALNAAANGVLRLARVPPQGPGGFETAHSQEELRSLLMQAVAAGTISQANQQVLTNAFEFGELKVRQIMTPRLRVDYLNLGQPIGQVLQTVQKSAYTRLPLCDGDIDHVLGMVHMKDLRKIKREVLFVPELLPVPKLLRQFQTRQIHMAVVVDEYGATLGIVTLEDVLEEIVGEIEDEFDTAGPQPFVQEGNQFRVNGLYALHELRERLPLDGDGGELDLGDVDTVGGYVIRQLKRWPRVGDTVNLGPFEVRVTSIQQKRVQQVLITPLVPRPDKTEPLQ
jgi:CBS domain containing-hemolysin-like protein